MTLIAEAIRRHGVEIEGEHDVDCECSLFHSPTPLLVRPVTFGDQTYKLCGVCADNIAVFVALMESSDGSLPWSLRREFGNRVREIGTQAWKHRESHQ